MIYLVFVLLISTPKLAFACSVCGFGQDGSQKAFLLTTGILTFLPLVLIVAAILYIHKRVKKHRYEE